jgi:hypothetical protein
VNETVLVELRNKNNLQQFASFSFRRIPLPITPFLAMMLHDSSSSHSTAYFIQDALETKEKEMGKNKFFLCRLAWQWFDR